MDDAPRLSLQREVLAPQRTSSGFGVMLVATGAMFFAVASSAFLLRARSHECLTQPRVQVVRPVGQEPRPARIRPAQPALVTTPIAVPTGDCGRALYEGNADGTVSVVFHVCPDTPDGVAVDRIVTE